MTRSKRAFDLAVALPALVLLAPVFAVMALLIWLDDGGPVFFRQERVGRGSRPFRIWKFRTMVHDAEDRGPQLTVSADRRITRSGRLLRRCKLDELPQLLNVVSGEMSLVGPRPEVPRYVQFYTDEQRRVLDLVPGITDPASICYRHEGRILARAPDAERAYLDQVMPEKLRITLEYADRASLWNDFLTVQRTLLGPLFPTSITKRDKKTSCP